MMDQITLFVPVFDMEPTPCERIILKIPRSKSQHYNLNFPSTQFVMELLSAKEARELQEAMLIEYCIAHGMFHCVADPTECIRWLLEMRKN